ncbi:GNAT family N-acetyltransferase [Ferdinandcohnia quinoae]|nr:GNAT family N-acetyltransferase [Fredinandcohnia sp. SECRCQ15]
MRSIRKLSTDEIPLFADIAINAYPGTTQNTKEFRERFVSNLLFIQEQEDSIDLFGLFLGDKLVGGMRVHYYQMNLFSKIVNIGGVGLVAVDLIHKKEKVAKDLICFFIEYFRERDVTLVSLYPFNPEFYKKMGFGPGTKINQYQVEPSSFPKADSKEGVRFLQPSDQQQILACYNRYALTKHGLFLKTDFDLNNIFKNPDNKVIGYFYNNQLEAYLVFNFEKSVDNFLINNIVVKELITETPTSLMKICGFLQNQADQIRRVIINTQDDSLDFLVQDARNGTDHLIPSVYHETNTSGTGVMYRIIQVRKFLENMNGFNFNNQSCLFKLTVVDSLYEETTSLIIQVDRGKLSFPEIEKFEFEITLDVAYFSSLFMGVIDPNRLYQYGKLKISEPAYLGRFNELFRNHERPFCLTAF